MRTITGILYHSSRADKSGHPYIGHPGRVAQRVAEVGGPAEAIAAAWLHDVVEDTWVSLPCLAEAGFPTAVVTAVDAVSKRTGETSEEYAQRIVPDALAVLVKRADLADNASPARLGELDPETRARLAAKYADFTTILNTALTS